jgi:hypothetical protein
VRQFWKAKTIKGIVLEISFGGEMTEEVGSKELVPGFSFYERYQ